MEGTLEEIQKQLRAVATPERAKSNEWFFKTDKGQYGYGDKFLGVNMPNQRLIAKKYYQEIMLTDLKKLLKSPYHEERLTALIILVYKFEKADEETRKLIVDFYLENLNRVNNWDLVDCSCSQILGTWLLDKDRKQLYEFAHSDNLWARRVAIVSNLAFIRQGQLDDTFKIADILLYDREDLIHKAVGWLLREAGKKDQKALSKHLDKNHNTMPRTMLRYAIEKYDEPTRQAYLTGKKNVR